MYSNLPRDNRSRGLIFAAQMLNTSNIAEVLWDEFASQGSTAGYANAGGTAAQETSASNPEGVAKLRAGALANQWAQAGYSNGTVGNILTNAWMVRFRAALSSATIAGTSRHHAGMCSGGAGPDPFGVSIGAFGAGNAGGSNTKFTLETGSSGAAIAGTPFSLNLDILPHEFAVWYPGSGSLAYGMVDGELRSISTTGIVGIVGQVAGIAHPGDQVGATNGIDICFLQVLVARV